MYILTILFCNYIFRIFSLYISIGRVGKTSILLRYVRNAFDERQISTISASCFDKQVPIGGGEVSIVIIRLIFGDEERNLGNNGIEM